MKTLVPSFVLALVFVTAAAIADRPAVQFSKPTQTPVAEEVIAGAAAADFDGDGRADMAVGLPRAGIVQVLLASGRGAFAAPVSYAVAPGRGHLAIADFNNDSLPDVVFAGGGIAVLPGHGDGTFGSPIVSFGSAADVVAADFDGDGLIDIASVGKNSLSSIPDTVDVYPGGGDGTFGAPRTLFTSDNGPTALAAGDLNGDGRVDLVFGVRDLRQLLVYLNGGDFAFTPHGSAFIEVGPSRTIAGDVDGNGAVDVVTANFLGSVSLLAGNGDGTLAPAQTFAVGGACSGAVCPAPQWAALGDLNGDTAPDIVTANQQPGSASILLNDGTGLFGAPMSLTVLSFAYAAVPGDFDGDGITDLAVASSEAGLLEPGERIVSTFVNRRPLRGKRWR